MVSIPPCLSLRSVTQHTVIDRGGRLRCALVSALADVWGGSAKTIHRERSRATNRLLNEILRDPFTRIGKLEHLRHVLAGSWFHRSTGKHRLV